jgi:glycosyltransferase involved in cell wall biosynthesis
LALRDRVKFVDWIDHASLPETLRSYRALVSPALTEANGIAVQEAMVLGLPVIALNWGGPSLLITDESGILIEPRNEDYVIDELAQAMDVLAEDGDLAGRMSAAGRQRAIDQGFAWPAIISQWADVYQRISGHHALSRQPAIKLAYLHGISGDPREAHAEIPPAV